MTGHKNPESENLYEVLGVSPKATMEEIREVYRDLARAYHPDSNFYDEIVPEKVSPEQVHFFKIVTAAYNTLTDPQRRAEYDSKLQPLLNPRFRTWDDPDADVWEGGSGSSLSGNRGYAHASQGVFGRTDNRGKPLTTRGMFESAPSVPPSVAEILRSKTSWTQSFLPLILGAVGVGVALATVLFFLMRG